MALCAGLFGLLMWGMAAAAHGATWPWVTVALATGSACGYALWRRERGREAPILAADLFRVPFFALSSVTSLCAFAIQGLVFVVLPLFFQLSLGYSQVQAGLLLTP